jgi:hypothetical protein
LRLQRDDLGFQLVDGIFVLRLQLADGSGMR